VEPIGLQTVLSALLEDLEALDSAVVISMEVVPQLEGLVGGPMEALEGPALGLEDVARFLVSNAGLCRSNRVRVCPDNSAVACLESSAGVSHDSSAASSVFQSAGARFAASWELGGSGVVGKVSDAG